MQSASKSQSILSLISTVSVSSSLLSFVIASSAYLDSQVNPYPSLLPFVTVRRQADSHGSIPMIPTAVSTAAATFERIEFAENPSLMAGLSGRQR